VARVQAMQGGENSMTQAAKIRATTPRRLSRALAAHDFAAEFRVFRAAHHLTQPQLAAALDMSLRPLKSIELRETIPSAATRAKFRELKQRYEQEKLNGN
jgi:DNA-binding transcriptional regulator YiaG